MNAILSVLVALVMAFNLGGGLMSGLEEPVSLEAEIGLNTENLTAAIPALGDESQAQILKLAADVLNVAAFRGTADKQTVELALTAGEDTVVSLGVRSAEDGMTLATSLAEGTALNMSAETVQQLQGQMAGQMDQLNEMIGAMTGLDQEALMQSLLESMDHAVDAVKEKAGEAETGEFWVDELEFSTKAAVDMTTKELATVLLNAVKEYVSQESFQKLFAVMGESASPVSAIDEVLENLQNQVEEKMPKAEIALYGNAEGEAYVAADLKQEAAEETPAVDAHIGFGTEFQNHRVNVTYTPGDGMPSFVTMNLQSVNSCDMAASIDAGNGQELFINLVKTEGMPIDGVVGVRMMGMFIRALLDSATADGRTQLNARILLTKEGEDVEEAEDLEIGTASVSWGKGGTIVSVFDGDGVKTVAVEPLLQGEGGEDMNTLMGSVMAGAMKALNTLTSHLPEDSAAMLNGLLQGGAAVPAE